MQNIYIIEKMNWFKNLFLKKESWVKVKKIINETHDMKVFYIEKNSYTDNFKPGQFVNIGVKINGKLEKRSYSIVSPCEENQISFMVKKIENGLVSNWLHNNIKEGDSLLLGEAMGEFTVDLNSIKKLCLLSGGSGITPVMCILRDIKNKNIDCDVIFFHAAKTLNDIPFKSEFKELNKDNKFKFVFIIEENDGRPTQDKIKELVPDLFERTTYLCGPSGMTDAIIPLWNEHKNKLIIERFSIKSVESNETVKITLKNNKEIFVKKGLTLLESLEKQNIWHPSSCRAGICNMCVCKKLSGETKNISDMSISSGEEDIKLCISVPNSSIKLDK